MTKICKIEYQTKKTLEIEKNTMKFFKFRDLVINIDEYNLNVIW